MSYSGNITADMMDKERERQHKLIERRQVEEEKEQE